VRAQAGGRPRIEAEARTRGLAAEPQLHAVGVFLGVGRDTLPERDVGGGVRFL
jgi:hypothetical protein